MTDKNHDDTVLDKDRVTEGKNKIEKPKMWQVTFLNDNFTSIDFVVEQLQKHFKKSLEQATTIAHEVHTKGSAVAGVYQFDVAETKAHAVLQEAKAREFPLQLKLSPTE